MAPETIRPERKDSVRGVLAGIKKAAEPDALAAYSCDFVLDKEFLFF